MLVVYNILFFIMSLNSLSVIDEIRIQYFEINSIDKADYFLKALKEDNQVEAIGYIGAMYFVKSRIYKSPFKKMKYFKKGKSTLDEVIESNPFNIELLYIRYSLQKKVPKFLGYNTHIVEDLSMIQNEIGQSELPIHIKSLILKNILVLNDLSKSDKKKIENLIINI